MILICLLALLVVVILESALQLCSVPVFAVVIDLLPGVLQHVGDEGGDDLCKLSD